MSENDKLLASLFGDAQLEPTKKFEKELRTRLRTPRQHLHHAFQRVLYASLVMVMLLLAFGVTRLQRPASPSIKGKAPNSIAVRPGTVLAGNLLATVMSPDSSQLPDKNITFWKLQSKKSYGPAAAACLQTPGQSPEPTITTLLYDDHHTTAVHQTYGGNSHYSDDPMISAVNLNSYLGLNNSGISDWIGGAVLSDANGNPIDPNLPMPYKSSGSYDLYMRYAPAAGTKDYVAACTPLIYHITIDAASGVYTSFAAYRASIAPENLDVTFTQTVETQAAPSFAAVEPQFVANGFDLKRADLATDADSEGMVNNPAAGFSFGYHETLMGKVSEQDIKDAHGNIAAYQYHFSKAPKLVMLVRTPNATDQYPKTMSDFQAYAAANNLTLGRQWGGQTDNPTLGQITIAGNLATGDNWRAYFEQTGSPSTPSEFIEDDFADLPLQQAQTWVDLHAGQSPHSIDPMYDLQVQVYKPGSSVPAAM